MSTPHSHAQAVAAIGAAARAWASWHSRRYKSGNARVRTRDRDSWIAKVTGLVPEDWWDKWTAEQQAGFVRDMSAIKAKFDAEQRPIGSAPLSLPSPTEETCSRTLFRMRRSVSRIRYIVHKMASHFNQRGEDGQAAVDWFEHGFHSHLTIAFFNEMATKSSGEASEAAVAVAGFEAVLKRVKEGEIATPAALASPRLPPPFDRGTFPVLWKIVEEFDDLHPGFAEARRAREEQEKRKRQDSDERPESGEHEPPRPPQRRLTEQEKDAMEGLGMLQAGAPRSGTFSLAHHSRAANGRLELSPRQQFVYQQRWARF